MKEKLVRDNIPDIIKADGKTPDIRIATTEEYKTFLLKKLDEEVKELLDDPTDIGEYADVLEVIEKMKTVFSINETDLEIKRSEKNAERGKFDVGYILKI